MAENNITATRESLIAEIQRRVDDKILEQTNADLLTKLIRNADTLDEAMAIAQLGTTYKRTGLHYDKRLEKQRGNTIKYFKKNEQLSFSDGSDSPHHKLIIGDNYDALQNLLIQYRGKVDVIYIDPPYGKDSMGEFAQTNYDNAITRDNLLSMLHPRLNLSKQILAKEGVIFCSIDDKNYAYVKLLMDEVFGEKNYIATYLWKKTDTPPALSNKVRKKYEYVLCYGLDVPKSYKFAQGHIDGGDAPLLNESNSLGTLTFPIGSVLFNIPDGEYSDDETKKIRLLSKVIVCDGRNANEFSAEAHWKWSQENLKNEVANGTYFLIKSKKFSPRYQKIGEMALKTPQNNIDSSLGVGTNEEGTSILDSILKPDVFDNPKPTTLIEYLINMVNKDEDITILDFFAGSGTTLHATLNLNRDEGKRCCILCTNNEITEKNPNGIALDATTPRLKRIMTGSCYKQSEKYPFYTGCNDFAWLKDNEPFGGSLDVYEIESVSNAEHVCGKTPFDVIDETLYGKEKFESLEDKIRWVCENFEATQDKLVEKE
ncbi:MAG: site-specific DNA-methyltransferase [Bacteroidaceae bacterium]|nr:site-specific DNA-methyltransferase [Bacteroidaceae bacterium]